MFDLIVRRGVCRLLAAIALVVLSASQASAHPPGFVYALEQVRGAPQQIYGFRLDPFTGALTPPGFPWTAAGQGRGLRYPNSSSTRGAAYASSTTGATR